MRTRVLLTPLNARVPPLLRTTFPLHIPVMLLYGCYYWVLAQPLRCRLYLRYATACLPDTCLPRLPCLYALRIGPAFTASSLPRALIHMPALYRVDGILRFEHCHLSCVLPLPVLHLLPLPGSASWDACCACVHTTCRLKVTALTAPRLLTFSGLPTCTAPAPAAPTARYLPIRILASCS